MAPLKFFLRRTGSNTAALPADPESPFTGTDEPNQLIAQLRYECDAMARHALQHALTVPPELIARLAILIQAIDQDFANATTSSTDSSDARLRELTGIHRKLAHAVAPATPLGITILDRGRRQTRFAWLGPVPLIRILTVTSAAFLVLLIISSLPQEISAENMSRGILDYSGKALLLNMLFLLNCAGLGASFGTLFHAHRYISNSTYDPKYDASYVARVILGLIAGLILVELLPSQIFQNGALATFGKPALSMLGGFSATAVQRLLQRLVEALETLVRGDPSMQMQATLDARHAHAATERLQSQNDLAVQLLALQQSLDSGVPQEEFRQRLAELAKTMLSPESASASQSNDASRSSE